MRTGETKREKGGGLRGIKKLLFLCNGFLFDRFFVGIAFLHFERK